MRIWNAEYPAHLAHKALTDLDSYLTGLGNPEHLLVTDEAKKVIGWLVTFDRDNARWFTLLLDRTIHGKGIGSHLLDIVKNSCKELSGWVTDHGNDKRADGSTYPSPINFYKKNGFRVLENIRLEKGALSAVKIQWSNA